MATLFAASTYLLARSYLFKQRTDAVQRRAALDARVVSARLATNGTQVADVLNSLDPTTASTVLVHEDGQWYSSSLDTGPDAIPDSVLDLVARGVPAIQVTEVTGRPAVVIGIPMPSVSGELVEVAPLDDLVRSLNILALILVIGSFVATAVGVGIALWSSRRLLEPLDQLAAAAAEIAGGELSRRLETTQDPDLVTIVGSFNSMVDALQGRIERDARFAADVSHELRTPLTALVAAVDVLAAKRDGMSDRQSRAVDVTATELARFRHLLDDLIELARYDAGAPGPEAVSIDIHALLAETLQGSGRNTGLLHGARGAFVRGDKRRLERIFLNLMNNADRYGAGLVNVSVEHGNDTVSVQVDDAGPGVPALDRERIFARFATRGGGRGGSVGTGLGLAIVQEAVTSLGGTVRCTSRPEGGARFIVDLPIGDQP